ncbi:MAG TPA: glycosyltransferase family 4 protein [Anaerolineales bacterium]|nr:glycosyltransferase family 4 protein [Anaerolineales bacterium]
MVEGDTHWQVGYILRSYPRLSQTFILNEILALERLGLRLAIFALERAEDGQDQPQVAAVHAPVFFLEEARRQGWVKRIMRHLAFLFSSPAHYLGTLRFVLSKPFLDHGYRNATRLECFDMAVYLARLVGRDERRVSHLHAHFAHDPALVALLTNRLAGMPYSFTAHARDLYQLGASALFERTKKASVVVTCCEANRDHLSRLLPESLSRKVRLIYHGVDLEQFRPISQESSDYRSTARPVILSIGRLVEKKGFPALLQAFRLLKEGEVHFEALIFGDGPLRWDLEILISELDLAGQVTLRGARPQHELLPEFQNAALFALAPTITSDGDRDGIPNVLVEAMACGLPVVSTSVAGIPELVLHGQNGLLFSPGDSKSIAAGMAALLSDEPERRRMGEAARRTVVECFDLRASAGRLADLFQAVGTG